jgi:nicotinamidase-related amidase
MTTALVVIDVQRGFYEPHMPPRNNPDFETNLPLLLDAWKQAGQPIVLVRHDSVDSRSSLGAGTPGNAFTELLDGVTPDLMFTKHVNSAFHGEIDLGKWLDGRGITDLVLAGIQTNWCVETTARVGGNLGYHVTVAIDATFTFDAEGPNGETLTADQLYTATAVNLHADKFARVLPTKEVVAELRPL